MKRIISILLSALMVIAIIPVSVFMVSAEGETVDLYYNDFETAMNPNGGTQSSCERLDYNAAYGKAMKVWGSGRWEEPVTLNNATGAITIVMHAYTNNFVNQTTLGINGVQVVHCGGDSILKIGAVKGTANKAWRELAITVEIPDLSTGTANVTVANADGSYPATGTAELGAISDVLNLYVDAGNNSMSVLDIKVTQVAVDEPEEPEVPEVPEVPMDTLCEVGYTVFAGWSEGTYVEQTVSTNGTNGDVVIVFTPARNNWQTAIGANLLSVNGVSLITNAGSGNYNLGSTTVAAGGTARVITVTINVATGDATIVDTQGNSGTANVGAIGDKFTFKINQNQNNGWELTSLVAKQVIGEYVDSQSRENYLTFSDDFSSTTAPGGALKWHAGRTPTDGVLVVEPGTDATANRMNVGDVASVAGGIMTFDFMVPELPESGGIAIFHDRSQFKNYVAIVYDEDSQSWIASVGGDTAKNVTFEENTWYTATIIFGVDENDSSKVFINGSYVGAVNAKIANHGSGWGFAHFAGGGANDMTATNNLVDQNSATYHVDNVTFSARADETFVKVTGFQKTNVADGKYNVRFVAAVGDIFQGESTIGFEIVATYGDGATKSWNMSTGIVYNSITTKYGTETVAAEDIGGKYVTAVAITGVPSELDSVTFTVKPYVVINGVTVYGSTVTVTVHPEA